LLFSYEQRLQSRTILNHLNARSLKLSALKWRFMSQP